MKIHFIGTGSAFTLKNYHTNFVLEDGGQKMLIDAGSDVRFSLKKAGMSYKDIDVMYLSHGHGDHLYGAEYLGFISYFDPTKDKIKLYGNGDVLRHGWDDGLKASMGSLQMMIANLETYYDVTYIRPNGSFNWLGNKCTPFATVHIMNGYSIVPSYGLRIKIATGEQIYFTTDTQHAPHQLLDMYRDVDFIIQDTETSAFKSGVHANYMDLRELPADIKAKMALTHYGDNVMDDDGKVTAEWADKAKADGFYGFVDRGTVIDTDKHFIDLEKLR